MKGFQEQFLTEFLRRQKFAEAGVFWRSFPNNNGHRDFPGCFRCHDGKHLSEEGKPVRLHCNICHNIPVVVKENVPPPKVLIPLELVQPDSHLEASFMAEHRFFMDESCEACHGELSFGTEGDSFCSNPAHQRKSACLRSRARMSASSRPLSAG